MLPDILDVIGRLSFRPAKTMPHIPHEYTVRDQAADEADYVALFEAIQEHGIVERWKRRKQRVLYPGDGFRYWAMTTNVHQTLVLNRCTLADADDMRAKGWITPA